MQNEFLHLQAMAGRCSVPEGWGLAWEMLDFGLVKAGVDSFFVAIY